MPTTRELVAQAKAAGLTKAEFVDDFIARFGVKPSEVLDQDPELTLDTEAGVSLPPEARQSAPSPPPERDLPLVQPVVESPEQLLRTQQFDPQRGVSTTARLEQRTRQVQAEPRAGGTRLANPFEMVRKTEGMIVGAAEGAGDLIVDASLALLPDEAQDYLDKRGVRPDEPEAEVARRAIADHDAAQLLRAMVEANPEAAKEAAARGELQWAGVPVGGDGDAIIAAFEARDLPASERARLDQVLRDKGGTAFDRALRDLDAKVAKNQDRDLTTNLVGDVGEMIAGLWDLFTAPFFVEDRPNETKSFTVGRDADGNPITVDVPLERSLLEDARAAHAQGQEKTKPLASAAAAGLAQPFLAAYRDITGAEGPGLSETLHAAPVSTAMTLFPVLKTSAALARGAAKATPGLRLLLDKTERGLSWVADTLGDKLAFKLEDYGIAGPKQRAEIRSRLDDITDDARAEAAAVRQVAERIQKQVADDVYAVTDDVTELRDLPTAQRVVDGRSTVTAGEGRVDIARDRVIGPNTQGLVAELEALAPERLGGLAKTITDTIDSQGPELFASPKLQQLALQELERRAGAAGMDGPAIGNLLERARRDMKDTDTVGSYQLPSGTVTTTDLAASVIDAKPKLRRQIVEEAIGEHARKAGAKVQREASREAFEQAAATVDELAQEAVAGRPAARPLRLEEGQTIDDVVRRIEVAAEPLLDTPQARANLDRYLDQLELTYRPLGEEAAGYLGVTEPTLVPKLFDSTLKWQAKADRMLGDDSIWRRLQQAAKANLTGRSLRGAMNNLGANMVLQLMRRGDPAYLGRALLLERQWSAFKAGKLGDPALGAVFREWEKSNLLDSDMITAELGGVGQALSVPGFRRLDKASEAATRWGDNSHKLEEASSQLAKYRSYTQQMEPGSTLTLPISENRAATLIKSKDGSLRLSGREKALTPDEATAVMARASANAANAIFFDYGKTGRFQNALKASPMLGVVNPFLTWMWKALDTPWKKGLGARTVDPLPTIRTTSANVKAQLAADAVALSTRRALLVSGIRDDLQDSELVKRVLSFAPKEMRPQLVRVMADPSYVQTWDLNAYNYMGPTLTLARTAAWGAGLINEWASDEAALQAVWRTDVLEDAVGGEAVPSNLKARRGLALAAARGDLADFEDVAELVGLSGGPMLDVVMALRSTRAGEADFYKVASNFLIGGTTANVAKVLAGVAGPDRSTVGLYDWSGADRNDALPKRVREDQWTWAVRKLVGLGMQTVNIEQAGMRYFEHAGKELDAALIERRAKLREYLISKRGVGPDDPALVKLDEEVAIAHEVIRNEVTRMRTDWEKVRDLLQPEAQPRRPGRPAADAESTARRRRVRDRVSQ